MLTRSWTYSMVAGLLQFTCLLFISATPSAALQSATLSLDSSVQTPGVVHGTVTLSPPPQSTYQDNIVEIADSVTGCRDTFANCGLLTQNACTGGAWGYVDYPANAASINVSFGVPIVSRPTTLSMQFFSNGCATPYPPSNVATISATPPQLTIQAPAAVTMGRGEKPTATVTAVPASATQWVSPGSQSQYVWLFAWDGVRPPGPQDFPGPEGYAMADANGVATITVFVDSNPEPYAPVMTSQMQWLARYSPYAGHTCDQFASTGDTNDICAFAPLTVYVDNSADLGSSCPPSGNEGTCGQPINLRTGNTYIAQQDYSLPGLGDGLGLIRTWNSLWPISSPVQEVGMFGDSWISNYEERLQVTPNSQAKYWRGDGSAWMMTWNSSSQTYTVTSPPDEHASLAFDTSTSLFTLSFPDGRKEVFTNTGLLQNIIDNNRNQVTLTYDSSTRLIQVADAASRVLTFNYANSTFPKQVSSIQDSAGTIASYTYLPGGLLNTVTYADGSVKTFTYDPNNLILSVTDTNSKILESHTYDATRRGLTTQRANGVDLVTANYSGNSATISDTNGNMSTYGITRVGSRNLISSITGPGCNTCVGRGNWSYTYDAQGNRTKTVDPLGHFTNYTYDSNGNVLQRSVQRDAANDTQNWNYTYNSFNEVLTFTDPLGNQTVNTYDLAGNLLTTTTPAPGGRVSGSKTTFAYDTKGELTSITDAMNNKTSIFYTSVGLVDHITDAQSQTTKFTYDGRGNRTSITDANNQQTTFTYDSMNRLTKITYPSSPATFTQFGYDYRGRKTSVTDPNGKVTQYAYDDADRLVSVTDANNGTIHYAYDSETNLTSITDAAGNQTMLRYDAYGSVTQVAFPSSWAETYSYDLNGNLLTKTDRNGHVVNYGYDFLNRLTSKSYPDGTSIGYIYDLGNRLTQVSDPTGTYSFTYDGMNRLMQSSTTYSFISGTTFTEMYSYDANSNRTSMTDPQNASTSYAFDSLNRLTTLTYPKKNYAFSYDALSRRTQLTRPNGIATNYQYDALSRLISVVHQGSTTTLDGATYVYDPAGNRTSKTDKRTNVTSTFSYDPLYELTQVLQGSTTTESYTYDAVGNRLSSLGASPYSYNASNELTSAPSATYTFDKNGNTATKITSSGTTQYNWDFENRLTSVVLPGSGGTVSFKYDPFGRRIQKTSSAGATNYVYDGVNLLEEVDGSGNVLARYVQGTGIDEPLAETRGSTTSYYEADGLGSITSLSNSSGTLANTYTYDSYGRVVASTGTLVNPLRYAGRDFDQETGLYYLRARYYDAAIGRFISEDPLEFLGGDVNFYAYVRNDPINLIDPWGLHTEVILWNPVGIGESSFGHISVIINGTSYSWGPGPGGSVANKCCKPGKMDIETPADKFIQKNTAFRSGLGYVLNLTPAQETAFANYLTNFKANYNVVDRNCGGPVVSGLESLGIQLKLPADPITGLGPLVIMPDDLDYAFARAPGLVNGWVPYPQVSTKK